MLGERIKKLRKERKLTLEALAGKNLTKGMLSLIENNKAKPSMESLTYIAERLDVEVAELLNTVSKEDLKVTLEKAETLFHTKDGDTKANYKEIIQLIEPIAPHLTSGYEASRLLQLYAYALYNEKQPIWEEIIRQSATLFDELNLSTNRAFIASFLVRDKFTAQNYVGALKDFLRERKHIEESYEYIDPLARLELDYHEATLYFAVGDSEAATKRMEEALAFSREKKIFFRIDDLYRLAAAHAMMSKDYMKLNYYLEKLQQYGEFADHEASLHFKKLFNIVYLIEEKEEYENALNQLDSLLHEQGAIAFYTPWFLLEKGKALYYLNKYEEALNTFDMIVIPEDIHHPFDLSIFYVMDVYKALTFTALGKTKEGQAAIKKVMDRFAPLPSTPYKEFCQEVYSKLK